MKIIIGHSNMDLDCIGSISMAKYLFPDHIPVKSRHIHPVARKLQNLYQHHLDFRTTKELDGEPIERVVIVDTRTRSRVKEYFDRLDPDGAEIEIFDHHPSDEQSFPSAILHQRETGANTSQLVEEVMERGIPVSPEDATIALTGIYADTGNFTHENVADVDFHAAAYLISCGANIDIIQTFLRPLSAKYQVTLFHDLLNRLQYRTIHGQRVIISYFETEEESDGLGAVTEKVFEVEDQDVYFALFHFPKREKTLIISRNRKHNIRLNEIMQVFGGGGHEKAASATVKGKSGSYVYSTLMEYLEDALAPAVTAEEIMTSPVTTIPETASLLDASFLLEEISHTGVPVIGEDAGNGNNVKQNGGNGGAANGLDGNRAAGRAHDGNGEEGKIVGFLTLRDIMKGRRADQMHAPVKAYMARKLISAAPETTVREIEETLFSHNIGHLPVVRDGHVVGIITRSDYLDFRKSEHHLRARVMEKIGVEA